GSRYDFDATPVTGDLALYAHWTEVPPAPSHATVWFDSVGGSSVSSQSVEVGKPVSRPADPSRDGYVFDGWYTERTGGEEYDFSAPVNGNVTLYAHWTRKQAEKGALKRLAGATRYETMGAVVSAGFPGRSEYVVVASGDNFPDALSASSLAGGLKAPIVLTGSGGLNAVARERVRASGASKAVVIGSTVAVSAAAASELRSMGLSVDRIQGSNRYDTNVEVYKAGRRLGVDWSDKLIVATGEGYADALSISSYAYRNAAPILLATPTSGLSADAVSAIGSGSFSSAVIVGSNVVVSDWVDFAQLPALGVASERVAGPTRYETSAKVAEWCVKQGMGMDGAVFASGEGFADALAAGPLAGRSNAALMLVRDPSSPAIALAGKHAKDVSKAWVVGSDVVVDNQTMHTIADTLGLEVE
ncbi:cell wall-binding repeat-containing protein, partial [Bifidobacterium parmae]